MNSQSKLSRAWTFRGLLVAAGVGLLLLPLGPAAAQFEKKFERKDRNTPQGDKGEAERREEVKRLQQQIQERQKDLQQRMDELQRVIQRLQQVQEAGQGPMGGGAPGGVGGQGPRPMGDPGPGGLPPGGKGGFPGGPGGVGGLPPGGGGAGPMPGGGPPMGGNIEHRLNKLEQKLDLILQELRSMRGQQKGPKAVLPKGPGTRPFDPTNPPPGGGGSPMPPRLERDPNTPLPRPYVNPKELED